MSTSPGGSWRESILDLPPVHADGGDLCPVCGALLKRTMMHYRVKGIYVGMVEVLRCPLGHYLVLTERGYEEARKRAEDMGLLTTEAAGEQIAEWKEPLMGDNMRVGEVSRTPVGQDLIMISAGQ
ncbi:MAG: hypothetical protein ACP5UD_08320 [Conexivisphaera sp.]